MTTEILAALRRAWGIATLWMHSKNIALHSGSLRAASKVDVFDPPCEMGRGMVNMSDDEQTAAARWTVKAELRAVGRDKPLLLVLAAILCFYCAFIAGPIVYAVLAINGIADFFR
ncbi:hypothetical protein NKJ70_28400 [Mesorhizobium sp. M0092]|uniref:hypothetical protein n=1 Tax=Mesorhizobium sp. M0092 TaxID=2956876 RepID=UPI003334E484